MCKGSKPVNFLKEHGLHVVRSPRTGIEPLDLFEQQDRGLRALHGSLRDRLKDGVRDDLPDVREAKTADFNGQETAAVEASLGLSLLASAFPPYKAKLRAAYDKAQQFYFKFTNAKLWTVDVLGVEAALDDFQSQDWAAGLKDRAEEGDLFVASAVMTSRGISVHASDARGTALGVDVSAQEIAETKIDVKTDSRNEKWIEYSGDLDVVFAIEARRFVFANGRFRRFTPSDLDKPAYGVGDAAEGLVTDGEGRIRSTDIVLSVEMPEGDEGS